ncbi:phage tail tape measure protein [Oharaeibacter diazotrophicus]|uniref:Lambda family phage tail tape measure protein n=1 Tax=Oharaeibacter diazotrophicus TaxID=1920512 RepID=A0A4R6RC15_9HYPH|nr:phage tail tape measure protein [Oharaeibacter diazotrophicus]TDP83217.1 hypothetical protein EDD54_3175 [Oharaeibacter diazotrophicus]BBE72048.1 hypothetical protein OHA_1_01635 [Pleomorphomonas sp. SM30]GLS78813.1 hypothetical protein GCM10007904_41500 [Oharaeibacter diazotrophicus]
MADDTDTLAALDGRLAASTAAADRFGSALTGALRAAVVEGKALDEVFQKLLLQLSDAALAAALKPLSSLLSGLAGSALGGLGGLFSGGAAAGASALSSLVAESCGTVAAPAWFPEVPTAAGSTDANAPAAGAAGAVAVTFNVRTPDAASFRASEAQVGRMLARAVGRGRRGL